MDRLEAFKSIAAQAGRGELTFPTNVDATLKLQKALNDPDCHVDAAARLSHLRHPDDHHLDRQTDGILGIHHHHACYPQPYHHHLGCYFEVGYHCDGPYTDHHLDIPPPP